MDFYKMLHMNRKHFYHAIKDNVLLENGNQNFRAKIVSYIELVCQGEDLLTAIWRLCFSREVEVALYCSILVLFISMVSHLDTRPFTHQTFTTLELTLQTTFISMQWTLGQD